MKTEVELKILSASLEHVLQDKDALELLEIRDKLETTTIHKIESTIVVEKQKVVYIIHDFHFISRDESQLPLGSLLVKSKFNRSNGSHKVLQCEPHDLVEE